MPENEDFSRDLGYLDKFFDKLDAHAGNLPEGAGQRLRALVAEERGRWTEIRQLVGSAPAAAASAAAPAPAATEAPAAQRQEPERPYTRALKAGMAQLAGVSRTPDAGPAAMGSSMGSSPPAEAAKVAGGIRFTVGSLKPRR